MRPKENIWNKKILRNIIWLNELFDNRTSAEIENILSRYAWENDNPNKYGEMIAEAWAEYCNNLYHREIAQAVGETIEAKYHKKFGLK